MGSPGYNREAVREVQPRLAWRIGRFFTGIDVAARGNAVGGTA